MSTDLTRNRAPRRRLARRNSMAFPRELRDAISPLLDGRVLELESIDGQASNSLLFGRVVELRLTENRQTERLVRGAHAAPARSRAELAGRLTSLADEAG